MVEGCGCPAGAGRAITTASFLQATTPVIYQNIQIKYGYVRVQANATTLITQVRAAGLSSWGPPPL